jgi:hypothetical protein
LYSFAAWPDAPAVVGGPTTTPTDIRSEKGLETLRAEVADLRRKVEKPPKDAWDKVTAISGLASGLAVALIGFYATNVYNRRQRLAEDRRKDQEILVSQIQTVEKFIPYLSSKDENAKSGALIAISTLGNEELAIKLATAFGGPGATAALQSIASTAEPQGAASAERALHDIRERVFEELFVPLINAAKDEIQKGKIRSLDEAMKMFVLSDQRSK